MLQTYKKNHRSVYVYLSESEKIIRSLRSYLGSGQLATEAAFLKADALVAVYTKIPDQSSRTIVGNFLVDVNLPELLTGIVRTLQRSHPEAFSLERLEASSTEGETRKKASKNVYGWLKVQVKRAAKMCHLFWIIAAKPIEKWCGAFYHPRVKPVLQQISLLQGAKSCCGK